MNYCLSICRRECLILVNGEICKTYGTQSGGSVAQQACDMAMVSATNMCVTRSTTLQMKATVMLNSAFCY